MEKNKLHIKNMVCPRCIDSVKDIFKEINIEITSIQLGEVCTLLSINEQQKELLKARLSQKGFELLDDNKAQLVSKIKSVVVNEVHYSSELLKVNFSTLLKERLNHDYAYLSRLFSTVEGITIEKFILSQKIEKVKELLFYDELTLSEIAHKMNYSSVAHISSQFKKETGMTPTQFKKQRNPGHRSLDSI